MDDTAKPTRSRESGRLAKPPCDKRRRSERYPLTLDVRYTILDPLRPHGSGHTVDISSSGVRIVADRPLPPGIKMELYVDWPLALEGGLSLQLVASGRVVWAKEKEAALQIEHHEFRTRGRGR